MNLVGRAAQHYLPPALREILLRKLYADTVAAFTSAAAQATRTNSRLPQMIDRRLPGLRLPPPPRGASAEELLRAYAEFTAAAVGTPSPELTRRLFQVSCGYGTWLRRALGIASAQDVMAAARLVYRAIGIEFEGTSGGEIAIRSCLFSRFYSPDVCRVMSALDAGLLAGLSNGSQLMFSQRITEGYACCRANLVTS